MPHFHAGSPLTAAQVNTIAHQGIQLLEEQTISTSQSSVTFSDIQQEFSNLELYITGGMTASDSQVDMTFNGDTGTNYTDIIYILRGDGTFGTTAPRRGVDSIEAAFLSAGSLINSGSAVINGYSRTDRDKLAFGSAVSGIQSSTNSDVIFNHMQGWWASTAAITTITLTARGTSFAAGSIFQLYGFGSTA